ncbi:MAG: DUF3267 domain-containing protein [Colwellia sp.]
MKLNKISKNEFSLPPHNLGWKEIKLGVSINEARFISYLTVILFVLMNAVLFSLLKESFFSDIAYLNAKYDLLNIIIGILISIVVLVLAHELCHLILLPEQGLSNSTIIAFIGISPCFIYNNNIGRNRFMVVLLGPFLILTPIFIAGVTIYEGLISYYLLFIHLTSCLGDLLLFHKIFKRKEIECLWSLGTSCWAKLK